MAVFVPVFFHIFCSPFQFDWIGLDSTPCPILWPPVDHLQHVLTLLILTLKMQSCFLKNSGSDLQDYAVPSPSRLRGRECLLLHFFNPECNMSLWLSPFFQDITGFIVRDLELADYKCFPPPTYGSIWIR
jgi:hypothetical protein